MSEPVPPPTQANQDGDSRTPDNRLKTFSLQRQVQTTQVLEDPAGYQAFVASLFSGIENKLATQIDNDVAAEIAALIRLLTVMPPAVVQQNQVFFELAYKLLQAQQPNLMLVRSIRLDLAAVNDQYVGWLARIVLFISGRTLLNAVLSALLTIFVMSFLFVLVMAGGVKFMFRAAGNGVHLTELATGNSFNELLLAQHGAILGSIVSIMSRAKSFVSDPSLTPVLAYVSLVTRPLLSVLVAMLVFCTLKSEAVSFHGFDLSGANGYYVAWAIGFLCGFSERLAQNFVAGVSQEFPSSTSKAKNKV